MNVNWLIALIGKSTIENLIRNRVLHVPDAQIATLAQQAGVTVAQWRAVEQIQANQVDQIINTL